MHEECRRIEQAVQAIESVLDKYGERMWEYQIEGLEEAYALLREQHNLMHSEPQARVQ